MLTVNFLQHVLTFMATMQPGVGMTGPYQDRVFSWSTQQALIGSASDCVPSLFFPTPTSCRLRSATSTALPLVYNDTIQLDVLQHAIELESTLNIVVPPAPPPWKPETLIDKCITSSLAQDTHILLCSDAAFEPEPIVPPSCSVIPKDLGFYLFCVDDSEPEVPSSFKPLFDFADAVSTSLVLQWVTTCACVSCAVSSMASLVQVICSVADQVYSSPALAFAFAILREYLFSVILGVSPVVIYVLGPIVVHVRKCKAIRPIVDALQHAGKLSSCAIQQSKILGESMADIGRTWFDMCPAPVRAFLSTIGLSAEYLSGPVASAIFTSRYWHNPDSPRFEQMFVGFCVASINAVWITVRITEMACSAEDVNRNAVAAGTADIIAFSDDLWAEPEVAAGNGKSEYAILGIEDKNERN